MINHTDNSDREIIVTMSPWRPSSLAALTLDSVELNHMCVGESRAGCGHAAKQPVLHRLTEEQG